VENCQDRLILRDNYFLPRILEPLHYKCVSKQIPERAQKCETIKLTRVLKIYSVCKKRKKKNAVKTNPFPNYFFGKAAFSQHWTLARKQHGHKKVLLFY